MLELTSEAFCVGPKATAMLSTLQWLSISVVSSLKNMSEATANLPQHLRAVTDRIEVMWSFTPPLLYDVSYKVAHSKSESDTVTILNREHNRLLQSYINNHLYSLNNCRKKSDYISGPNCELSYCDIPTDVLSVIHLYDCGSKYYNLLCFYIDYYKQLCDNKIQIFHIIPFILGGLQSFTFHCLVCKLMANEFESFFNVICIHTIIDKWLSMSWLLLFGLICNALHLCGIVLCYYKCRSFATNLTRLYQTLLTLAENESSTIAEMPYAFSDDAKLILEESKLDFQKCDQHCIAMFASVGLQRWLGIFRTERECTALFNDKWVLMLAVSKLIFPFLYLALCAMESWLWQWLPNKTTAFLGVIVFVTHVFVNCTTIDICCLKIAVRESVRSTLENIGLFTIVAAVISLQWWIFFGTDSQQSMTSPTTDYNESLLSDCELTCLAQRKWFEILVFNGNWFWNITVAPILAILAVYTGKQSITVAIEAESLTYRKWGRMQFDEREKFVVWFANLLACVSFCVICIFVSDLIPDVMAIPPTIIWVTCAYAHNQSHLQQAITGLNARRYGIEAIVGNFFVCVIETALSLFFGQFVMNLPINDFVNHCRHCCGAVMGTKKRYKRE